MGQSGNKTHNAKTQDYMKKFLIAQEFILHGIHYYSVEAETMGEAIEKIEEDPFLLPSDSEVNDLKILSYLEAEDNYDC